MKIINLDCIEAMKQMADNSVDSIVTDPPYELGFMGKSWDASGIAFNVDVWREALRVIKPGGHLIAFSGSRTYHRMAVAIEDAGFEIRDQIMWVYGSGFPKSHNISKGLDKAAGAERKVVGSRIADDIRGGNMHAENRGERHTIDITSPSTAEAKQWDGWGTALKPAHEPMVLARKPLIGTVANNVLTYGTGGLNIDKSRVGTGTGETKTVNYPDIRGNNYNNASGSVEYAVTDQGRWPANFIHDGSDEVVELFPDTKSGAINPYVRNKDNVTVDFLQGIEQVEKSFNYADSGSAARFFYCAKASKKDRNEGLEGFLTKQKIFNGQNDTSSDYVEGSVENKFTTQPSPNYHPTVKPTELMRYLCKLVTPLNGVILDPFMGSGSTGKGAVKEGFDFIGIDQSSEYCEIARARIEYALETLPEFEQEQLL